MVDMGDEPGYENVYLIAPDFEQFLNQLSPLEMPDEEA